MNGNGFFDTNLLVYLFDTSEPMKRQQVKTLFFEMSHTGHGYISAQVVNEFITILTKKIAHPVPWDEIGGKVAFLQRYVTILPLRLETSLQALDLKRRYGYAYWDCLILASALEGGCAVVYSEDMQHGQVIERTLTIRNPFAESAR